MVKRIKDKIVHWIRVITKLPNSEKIKIEKHELYEILAREPKLLRKGVTSSYSTSGTRHITPVTNLAIYVMTEEITGLWLRQTEHILGH